MTIKLCVIINGKPLVYERYQPGTGFLTPSAIIDGFQPTPGQIESIIWNILNSRISQFIICSCYFGDKFFMDIPYYK